MDKNKDLTTGELANTCNTTVRTVQYYDSKGLLIPSGYSEGGRRLYTNADTERLRLILMLKSLGLTLAQIKGVLESPNNITILDALLAEREQTIQEECKQQVQTLSAIHEIRSQLQLSGRITAMTEMSMAKLMEDTKARKHWYAIMVIAGIAIDALWISTLILGIKGGIWWPFPVALVVAVVLAFWLVAHYNAHVTYLCAACGSQFRPKFSAFFISRHSSKTRKLACPCCGTKDWCVEHYHAQKLDIMRGERLTSAN